MVEREVTVINRLGLHARAAAKLVHTAGGFQSRVTVEKDGEEVDAKSILGVLLLAAGQGSHSDRPGSSPSQAVSAHGRPSVWSP